MPVITRTLTVVVHPAKEGGYWGEVLELPGCVSQGETLDELQNNMREAIEAVMEVEREGFHADLQIDSALVEFRIGSGNPPAYEGWSVETRTWDSAG
jgi:predicted RNase H-like HicB family nuclease